MIKAVAVLAAIVCAGISVFAIAWLAWYLKAEKEEWDGLDY